MAQLATIYGGSGFVGRYITRHLAQAGWRVRVAVRHPNQALHVIPGGDVGQISAVLCNIRDDASVQAAMEGAAAVVNCVGVLTEIGKNGFEAVQHAGAARVARLAAATGVARLVQLSAIGSRRDSDSAYSVSKALGEEAVLRHMPGAVVLRPSVIFGPEDQFFNRFAAMARFGPFLPIVGGGTRFQPVYVDDVAQAAVMGLRNSDAHGRSVAGIFELGGPEVMTLRALILYMLRVIRRRRLPLDLPFPVAGGMAATLDFVQMISGDLLVNGVLTRDQLCSLRQDNVVAADAKGFADLGLTPTPMAAVVPEYLWRFRPSGQFADIKRSARNLRP
ncbi:MAG: complex I NDUFA9 subunit family protein [Rhodobacteraceae bacterium]|nr:complex I NDUFA9 subunit family protein [Paracoccaceae bacterium]